MKDNQIIDIVDFNKRSYWEILNGISDFKENFFQKDIPFKKIKIEIEKLCLGYRKENYHWFRFREGFYRARKHEDNWKNKYFNETADLWYRDWSKTDESYYKYGRLNHPGENFMYLSASRNASLLEVRPDSGDWVTVANIVPLTEKKLNLCLVAEEHLRQAHSDLSQIIKEPNKGIRKLSADSFEKLKLIDDFLIEIFTAKVEDENDFKYKTSIAVWEYLKELNSTVEIFGIMYPSIAFSFNAINIGLIPRAVDYDYFVDQLITFKVDSVSYTQNNTTIRFYPLKVGFASNSTYSNNKIIWRNPTFNEIREYSSEIEYSNKR